MKYIENLRNTIKNLLEEDSEVYLIGEDIADPYGGAFKVTKGLSTIFPERLLQTPMSEQGFTGMAIGLALNGLKPIVEIMFGDFITLISDQIINHISKFYQMYNKEIFFVLRTPSGGYRGYGPTHSQSLETIFLSVPGLYIVSPSVVSEPGYLLKKSVNIGAPVLFIENKLDYPQDIIKEKIYNSIIAISDLNIKGQWLAKRLSIIEENPVVTIIAYGGMIKYLIQIQEELFLDEEIPIEIISLTNINMINYRELVKVIRSNRILTVEEGWEEFGWGSHILLQLLKFKHLEVYNNIGAKRCFIPAAKSLEEYVLPSKREILRKILEMLN